MPDFMRRRVLATAAVALLTSMRPSHGEQPMTFVSTNGAMLATEAFGVARKGTILLAMGATASMAWWPVTFCQSLSAQGYRVIRFDHRDTGMSTTGEPGVVDYDLADLTGDLVAIMDAYEVPSAHLVGMSLGALSGQLLALLQPSRVNSLTLIAAEPLGLQYQGEGISDAFMAHFGKMQTLDWSDRSAVAAFMLTIAQLSAGSLPGFDRADAEARVAVELSRTSNMQSAFNHAMVVADLPPDLTAEAIEVPTLIIHGTEDPVISVQAARRSAEAIAGSHLVLLEGRGHELPPADVDFIAAEILTFLDH